jgi:hypothetical protein
MNMMTVVLQSIIALAIFNVWLVRAGRPTAWRPEGAASMSEEFRAYGYPDGMWKLIGAAKLSLAALLLAGIWYPGLAVSAGLGMAILMTGAVLSHLRVRDPLIKSLPSFTLLVLSLAVVYSNAA